MGGREGKGGNGCTQARHNQFGLVSFEGIWEINTTKLQPKTTMGALVIGVNLTCLSVCHAEMNAILNKNSAEVKGCTMYVALFPCNECSKIVIQSGVQEIVYVSDKYHDKPAMKASRRLLDMAGVKYRYVISRNLP